MDRELREFIDAQTASWPLASKNFSFLGGSIVRPVRVGCRDLVLQHNPCRIASSTAEVDAVTIAARPCFLCVKNRPKEQYHLPFRTSSGHQYNIQVNPFPIFPDHLVIARSEHTPQQVAGHVMDALDFVERYPEMYLYYNGPDSGASAPDHMHFQAFGHGLLPLEAFVNEYLETEPRPLLAQDGAKLYRLDNYLNGVFVLASKDKQALERLLDRFLACCEVLPGESEPRLNLYAGVGKGEFRLSVILRTNLRSHHYAAAGDSHFTMSPGAADVAGYLIAPVRSDFDRMNSVELTSMLSEVTLNAQQEAALLERLSASQKTVMVGIMSPDTVRVDKVLFRGCDEDSSFREATAEGDMVRAGDLLYDEFAIYGDSGKESFEIQDVTIGIDFHWQRKRNLKYAGKLVIRAKDGCLTVVNELGMEDYLLSVISSEMKSSASIGLLEAHAVISRSWLCRRMEEGGAHKGFDVCSDDHCQRYQGICMVGGHGAQEAIDATRGEVLRYKGRICDTRYSKCCGGTTEVFSSCWEDMDVPYLASVRDNDGNVDFCNCKDREVLSQVLNDYDLETGDFYEWEVKYTRNELSSLFTRKTGMDLGAITALEPIDRGPSGRIVHLKVKGTKGETVVGKELAIRKALSPSHLKSSAFDIIWQGDEVVLKGRGWGHGVGLCQIGAAVMAAKGYSYRDILSHYYPGAEIESLYE